MASGTMKSDKRPSWWAFSSGSEEETIAVSSIAQKDILFVVIAGASNTGRIFGAIPTSLLLQYPSQQVNGYINNTRVYVNVDYIDDTHIKLLKVFDSTYCDRVIIYAM